MVDISDVAAVIHLTGNTGDARDTCADADNIIGRIYLGPRLRAQGCVVATGGDAAERALADSRVVVAGGNRTVADIDCLTERLITGGCIKTATGVGRHRSRTKGAVGIARRVAGERIVAECEL